MHRKALPMAQSKGSRPLTPMTQMLSTHASFSAFRTASNPGAERSQAPPQTDHPHGERRSHPYGQCDSWPCHGCRGKGQIRPSRPADGRRRRRHRPVHAIFEIRRGGPEMAGPRPFCAFGRAWLDAALRAAVPHRQCRHDAGPAQAFPPVGIADPRSSGEFPHQGHRDHHRSVGPGHRHLDRLRAGGKNALGRVRQEDRQPSHLCARLRRRPDGRRVAGSDRACRALEA